MSTRPQPPHDHDRERIILGIMITYTDEAKLLTRSLEPHHFHAIRNRQIFEAMAKIVDSGHVMDLNLLIDTLTETHGQTDPAYLIGLVGAHEFCHWQNVDAHAKKLRELWAQREILTISSSLATDALNGRLNGNLATHKQKIGEIERAIAGPAQATTKTAAAEFLAAQKWRYENPDKLRGLSTGLDQLDKILDGLIDNKVYIIAGRQKMGKSAVGLSISDEVINQLEQGQKIAIFSLEMNGDELFSRLLARRLKAANENISRGRLTPAQWDRQAREVDHISAHMLIDTTPGVSPQYIKNRLLSWVDEGHDIKMVIIDHFHLMKPEKITSNPTADTRSVANDLVEVSKTEGIKAPFLVMAQCKKSVDERKDRRPLEGDIEYSGAITQVAQAVLMIYRDEHYYPEETPVPGLMEIIVRLNRDRPIGTAKVLFKGEQTAVYNRVVREIKL